MEGLNHKDNFPITGSQAIIEGYVLGLVTGLVSLVLKPAYNAGWL